MPCTQWSWNCNPKDAMLSVTWALGAWMLADAFVFLLFTYLAFRSLGARPYAKYRVEVGGWWGCACDGGFVRWWQAGLGGSSREAAAPTLALAACRTWRCAWACARACRRTCCFWCLWACCGSPT